MKMFNIAQYSLLLVLAATPLVAQQGSGDVEQLKAVDAALGRPGQMQPGGVYKYAMPRRDLKVTKDGVTIAPGLALGSWAAFQKMGDQAMLMGDLVLTEDEIEPVMQKLQQSGIEQSAIHNHLLGESPHIVYMHIEGHGDPVALAKSLATALALTKTPPPTASASATPPVALDIDTAGVEKALGYTGKANGGILQFSVPRVEKNHGRRHGNPTSHGHRDGDQLPAYWAG
jgi:hypothetical protein